MRSLHIAGPLAVLLALPSASAIADDAAPKGAPAQKAAAPAPKPAPAPAPAKNPAPPAAKPATKIAAKTVGKTKAGKKKKDVQDEKITGPVATYPNFRMLDDGASRVLVSISKKVNVTEHKTESKITYRIQGVHVPTSTNRLPLLTTFFATPVTRIELVNREGDADLVIDVKGGAAPQFRVLETDKGAELQVDFPKLATAGADDGADAKAAPASQGHPTSTKNLDSSTGAAY